MSHLKPSSLNQNSPLDPCKVCGLSFSPRAKWNKRDQVVLYCSQRCRRNKPSKLDRSRQQAMIEFLNQVKQKVLLEEVLVQVGFASTDQGRRKGKWAIHRLYHERRLVLWKEGKKIHPDQNKGRVYVEAL